MQTLLGVLVGLFTLSFLVAIHEYGHALFAYLNKVIVEIFAIGFPPKIWSKKLKNKTEFVINALPIGGYVKLKGEWDAANKKGDYGNVNFWAKTQILFGGVLMNFIFAALIFTVLAVTGLPQIIPNQFSVPSDTKIVKSPITIVFIAKDSPAEKFGLKVNDEIRKINSENVNSNVKVRELTQKYKGQEVEVETQSGTKKIKLNDDSNSINGGYLGVATDRTITSYSTWSAPIVGIGTTLQLTKETFKGLGDMLKNLGTGIYKKISGNAEQKAAASKELKSVGDSVAGPIGILGIIFPNLLSTDLTTYFLFVAVISISLGVMNMLPIPALDGGRWFVTALFKIFKKPLTKEKEEKIHGTGMIVLLLLMVIMVVVDVAKFL